MKKSQATVAKHSSVTTEHFTPIDVVERARRVMGAIDLDPASSKIANDDVVKASRFFSAEDNGFLQTWSWERGRVFLNPPGGYCDESGREVRWEKLPKAPAKGPKGLWRYSNGDLLDGAYQASAKAWWFKLVREWETHAIDQAIFVGFNMEILQSSQIGGDGPKRSCMDFPFCIPSRRLAFLYVEPGGTPRKYSLKVGSGPTHANVIVYLPSRYAGSPSPGRTAEEHFADVFHTLGACKA